MGWHQVTQANSKLMLASRAVPFLTPPRKGRKFWTYSGLLQQERGICKYLRIYRGGAVYCPHLLSWPESQHDLWPPPEPVNFSLVRAMEPVGWNNKPNASFLQESLFLWPLPAPSRLQVSCSDEEMRKTRSAVCRALQTYLGAGWGQAETVLYCAAWGVICVSLWVWRPRALAQPPARRKGVRARASITVKWI